MVVDDNSSDGTQGFIESAKANFKTLFLLNRKSNFGYGRSSVEGFKWVLERPYNHLVTMDADYSHDCKETPALLGKLNNFDVAVGSRYVTGGGVKNWNFFRRVLSRFANFYVKTILNLPVIDATTGFNAYRVGSLRKLNLEEISSDGYAFLVELNLQLFRAGCKFIEHPILFSERREGQSKMSSRVILESVWLPWKLRK